MQEHTITFDDREQVKVPTGTLLTEAAQAAGIEIVQPCGGQGRCGRCTVLARTGNIRRRSTLRLSAEDIALGYTLACQSVVEGDSAIEVPSQQVVERRLTTDRILAETPVPESYAFKTHPSIRIVPLDLVPPTMEDQTDDWSRVQASLRRLGYPKVDCSLAALQQMGKILRNCGWVVRAVLDSTDSRTPRLVCLLPDTSETPVLGAAIDIGTTTITVWLVDLVSGKVIAQAAEYNRQIKRGEDIISRIIYAAKNSGDEEMRLLVLETINELLERACARVRADPDSIYKATIAGNSTMMHLFLGIPAVSIRLSPFVTAANQPPFMKANEIGLNIHPDAAVDCLPGVASYVGADITAGVLSSGVDDSSAVSLFIDIGTNGEIVLGSKEWLVTCACSAGPAFEGAGVVDGMRATRGAIEEVWINTVTFEPTLRVIGDVKPKGICGSGLIALLAELFLTGLLDKGGNFNLEAGTPRIRAGNHGLEYVLVWGAESGHGEDIAITHVDVDNLIRAKAAIYAGFSVLADSVGVSLEAAERVLIGGAFGKYINVEKAIEIGLLPDMPWDHFHFLGNTSVQGAYRALLIQSERKRIEDIAAKMTYIELSADNAFYDAFTSALFLPHTDLTKFPNVRPAEIRAKVKS